MEEGRLLQRRHRHRTMDSSSTSVDDVDAVLVEQLGIRSNENGIVEVGVGGEVVATPDIPGAHNCPRTPREFLRVCRDAAITFVRVTVSRSRKFVTGTPPTLSNRIAPVRNI